MVSGVRLFEGTKVLQERKRCSTDLGVDDMTISLCASVKLARSFFCTVMGAVIIIFVESATPSHEMVSR